MGCEKGEELSELSSATEALTRRLRGTSGRRGARGRGKSLAWPGLASSPAQLHSARDCETVGLSVREGWGEGRGARAR